MPAPATPQWKTNMKMGSRIVFRTAPDSMVTMATRGLPSARMNEFSTMTTQTGTRPGMIHLPYSNA